jgi:nickel-dependent lactate racemase
MVDVWLPYGKSQVCVRVETRNFLGLIEPKEKPGVQDARTELERALKEPMGSERISELVKPENRVVLALNEASSSEQINLMLPLILEELKIAGIKQESVAAILGRNIGGAQGCEDVERELRKFLGNNAKIVHHDPKAPDLVEIGTTKKYGTKLLLNRSFVEADVRILMEHFGLHDYPLNTLLGICGEETVKHVQSLPAESKGEEGKPSGTAILEDMVEAAELAKIDFVLNLVVNSRKEIVKASAGNPQLVFSDSHKLVDEMSRVQVDRRADIVVVSPGGDPSDSNLFRAWDGIDSGLEVVKRGGILIVVAELSGGHGNQEYYDSMTRLNDLKEAEKEMRRNFSLGDAYACQHFKALQKAKIILVSSMPDYYAAGVFKLKTARAVNDALNEAFNIAGRSARVWAIPHGNTTVTEVRSAEEVSLGRLSEQKSV